MYNEVGEEVERAAFVWSSYLMPCYITLTMSKCEWSASPVPSLQVGVVSISPFVTFTSFLSISSHQKNIYPFRKLFHYLCLCYLWVGGSLPVELKVVDIVTSSRRVIQYVGNNSLIINHREAAVGSRILSCCVMSAHTENPSFHQHVNIL